MEVLVFTILCFAFLVPLVFAAIIPIYRNHNKATGGIINYDSTMKKFVYKVHLSNEEIIRLLTSGNDADELSCTFDFQNSVIRFTEYGSYREYFFQVQECNGFSVLRLEQVALIGMQSHVPYKLNPFMVKKLQAEMIPYSQYSFSLSLKEG